MIKKEKCPSMRSKKANIIVNFMMHIKGFNPNNFESKPSDNYKNNAVDVSESIMKLFESKRLKRVVSYLGIKINNQFFRFKDFEFYIGKAVYVDETVDGKIRIFNEQLTFLEELNPQQL